MTGDRSGEFGDRNGATRDRQDEAGDRDVETGDRNDVASRRNDVASRRNDDFYVGYLDETPPEVDRFVRRAALGLLLVAAALAAGLALLLERFDEGVFEYGTVRDWEGELLVDPVPRLVVDGGPAGGYLLVAEGKRGLEVDVPPALPGDPAPSAAATVAGTLIQNAEAAMIETRSLRLSEPPEHPPRAVVRIAPDTYGRYVGEIVDTKCYLGAMKPGRGKPHRACASLCIRGGVPAALLVRTRSGERALIHLMNALGQPVGREVLEFVGEAVEVTGVLRRADDRLALTVSPHRPAPVASATAGVSRHRPATGRRQGEAQTPANEAGPLR